MMDLETAEAFGGLRIDLRRVESTLSARIDRSEAALRGEMSQFREQVRDDFAEHRRHTQVLYESVRDDIRIVAEAVAALTPKVDALSRR